MSSKEYTKQGLERLFIKAMTECLAYSTNTCNYLYRNKSESYFEEIINEQNGVMEPYLKDAGNDPRNPMNNRLGGLYFMANTRNGEVPATSAFGSTRLLVPVRNLMEGANLYFADFFCLRGPDDYVNLVACQRGSDSNRFCRDKLIKCHKNTNPFFKLSQSGDYEVIDHKYLHVEIFITQPVDIKKEMVYGAYFIAGVCTVGKGSSTVGGLRKNRVCTTCNISDEGVLKDRSYTQVIEWATSMDFYSPALGHSQLFKPETYDESFFFEYPGRFVVNSDPYVSDCWIIRKY